MSLRLGNQIISGISRETKLNAHSLLDFKWADHILNEMSWLRADTFSWQSGDVYTSVYNLLLAEYQNGTEETEGDITFKRSTNGFKIATSSYENAISNKYNTDGISWYYILDTTNKRFKLPRTTHREVIESYVDGANGYRIWSDGYCEQWGVIGFSATSGWVSGTVSLPKTYANTNYCLLGRGNWSDAGSSDFRVNSMDVDSFNVTVAINTMTKHNGQWYTCGYLADGQYNKDSLPNNKNLYFYVGEFAQTATEQTAGLNSEMLNYKVDKADLTTCHVVVETYVNGTSGYRIWDDGYCEQWGYVAAVSSPTTSGNITFTKTFSDTNYNFIIGQHFDASNNGYAYYIGTYRTKSANQITYNLDGSSYITGFDWRACGYIR